MYYITRPLQELKQDYGFLLANSGGSINPLPGYEEFQVVSSYVSSDELYEDHLANLTNYFVNVYLKQYSKCIKNLKDVIKYYKKFVNYFGTKFPITKTNFILLPNVTPQVSGLIVNLEYSKNSEDFKKEAFFEDCDFQALQTIAAQKGFFIDKNNPWRLIVDVKSAKMNEIEVSGDAATIGSGFNILNRYYYEAYKEDLNSVLRFIMNSYNLFWRLHPRIVHSIELPNGRMRTVTQARESLVTRASSGISSEEWLKYVHMTRISELNISEEQKVKLHMKVEDNARKGRYLLANRSPFAVLKFINDDAKNHDPRFFKKIKPVPAHRGSTTVNSTHDHIYEVDKYGNGWALMVSHPDHAKIKHRHKIVNFVVQEAQSSCYPHCETIYGYAGAPPHIHDVII